MRPFRSLTAVGLSLAGLLTLTGMAGTAVAEDDGAEAKYKAGTAFTLPGPRAFPEGIAVDGKTGDFYVGSYATGAIFRTPAGQQAAEVFLPDGTDGRTTAAGLKVDASNRLWVTDPKGVMVYDLATRKRLAHFAVPSPESSLLNDLDIAPDGTAYITDSYLAVVYRVTPAQLKSAIDAGGGGSTLTTAHNLTGVIPPQPAKTVTLNGIEADATGSYLLTVDSAGGGLYRIDLRSGAMQKVTGTVSLKYGDGLHLESGKVWLAQYGNDTLSRLRLNAGATSFTVERQVVDATLEMPTTLVRRNSHLYVVRSQFDKMAGGTAELPFTIADVTGL
ncbi:SMP-30/gluconolactonase/LRE family protein [Streptomyces ficellus]|uniref:Superoxide dismutase n=1 Tax=Streptomyces ficellus TaxID=1977088 RepID=A0A6I6F6X4_9ACTN|nr:SMP-30/gluconolactonase/LRE family protein [Streptomyces ficellus]QGV78564.1 superoxide dismutase [Streptomyces ficellus]